MPADPWQCPACKTWMRADVTEHRCEPDEGGSTVPVVPPGGGGGGTSTATLPVTWTVTNVAGTAHSAYVPAPSGMTSSQIRELQDSLNALAGDQAWMHKIIVLPSRSRAA